MDKINFYKVDKAEKEFDIAKFDQQFAQLQVTKK